MRTIVRLDDYEHRHFHLEYIVFGLTMYCSYNKHSLQGGGLLVALC